MELIDINKIEISEKISYKQNNVTLYHRLVSAIKTNGQLKNLVVSKRNQSYILVDGYFVYKALKELGIKDVWCAVIEEMSEDELNVINMQLNTYFETNVVLLAKIFKRIEHLAKKINETTIYELAEIEGYKGLLEYNFLQYSEKIYIEQNKEENQVFF